MKKHLILEPIPQEPNVIDENGLLVVDAPCPDQLETIIDDLRSELINELSTWEKFYLTLLF